MKSKVKSKIIILITLGIVIALLPIISTNLIFITGNNNKGSDNSNDINLDKENLKFSAVWGGKIHIDNNWTAAKSAGIVTGNGTYSEPYIIENLVIDAGLSVSGILIENSDVHFRIENCTIYNGNLAGIRLSNVTNAELINNNFSFNLYGIYLMYSDNNTVSGNTANNNTEGINLYHSDDNTISGNNANNNVPSLIDSSFGIYLWYSDNNTMSGNTANKNNYGIYVQYSYNNTLSENIANNNTLLGILLDFSNYNNVLGNTANYNTIGGIYLFYSNYTTVSGNTLIGNTVCIKEENCVGNIFSDNGACTYGQGDGTIPGYNLIFLLGILSVVVIILSKKLIILKSMLEKVRN